MIHKEGRLIIITVGVPVILTGLALYKLFSGSFLLQMVPLILMLALLIFLFWFFRNPTRRVMVDDNILLSPADGRVVVMEKCFEKEYFKREMMQISVFMSPFNVHSNKYPVSGMVKKVIYHPGKYLVAWHPKSSELNERSTVVIETPCNQEIVVRQIAGVLARRIVTYAAEGVKVQQGEELGFIKFGSRVDLFVPLDFITEVEIGQGVRANVTRIGRFLREKTDTSDGAKDNDAGSA